MDGILFDRHLTTAEIEAGMPHVLSSPLNNGTLEMIVARPAIGKRKVLEAGELSVAEGLTGDNWAARGSRRTVDGSAHPEMQINIMNYRFAELIAGHRDRVPLAGDQLFVDLDLSEANIPPGTGLEIGTALLEITTIPHLGCKKFVERFGLAAMKYANSEYGRKNNLRGVNARVIRSGNFRTGDAVSITGR